MFRQYFDKLSMTLLNMTESCQPELVEGGIIEKILLINNSTCYVLTCSPVFPNLLSRC